MRILEKLNRSEVKWEIITITYTALAVCISNPSSLLGRKPRLQVKWPKGTQLRTRKAGQTPAIQLHNLIHNARFSSETFPTYSKMLIKNDQVLIY